MGRNKESGPEWENIRRQVEAGQAISSVAKMYAVKLGKPEKTLRSQIRVRKHRDGWQTKK